MIKIYDDNKKLFAELNYGKEYFKDYSLHSHETFCFSIISAGCLDIKFHTKTSYELKTNMFVFFNPGQVHKTSSKTSTHDHFTLHIDKNLCKNIQNSIFLNENFLNIENLVYEKNLYKKCLEVFTDIVKNNNNRYKDIHSILNTILEKYTLTNENNNSSDNNLIIQIEDYITENFCKHITIRDIASYIGYSESYITRIFKKAHGQTPHAFLINKRISQAKKLLLNNPNIDLATLSQEVCFYDQSHFTKTFKKSFAISPQKYTKSPKIF